MRCDEPGNAINENKKKKNSSSGRCVGGSSICSRKVTNKNDSKKKSAEEYKFKFTIQYLHFVAHKSTTKDRRCMDEQGCGVEILIFFYSFVY